jgi:hypothetical protein
MKTQAGHSEVMGLRGWAIWFGALSLLVATWFVINGYQFGVYDHSIHLPYLLRELEPSFLKGDPLVDAYAHHPSFFWKLQAPLARVLPIETLYLLIHVLSVGAMMAGTAALARAVLPKEAGPWAALLAPCLILLSKPTAAAVHMMDPLVLNRTVVLGPLLFALAQGIRHRYHTAFLLIGLAFLVHPTSAVQVAFMVWFAALLDREHRRAALTGPLVCLAAASPLLVSMLVHRAAAGVPFPPPAEWLAVTRLTVGLHHYPSEWPFPSWFFLLSPLLLLAGALRSQRSRPVELYMVAVGILFVGGALGTELIKFPTALHMHLLQSTRFLSFLAAACTARWILETWPVQGEPRRAGLSLAIAVVLTQFAFTMLLPVLVIWLLVLVLRAPMKKRESPVRLSLATVALLVLVLGGVTTVVRRLVLRSPPAMQPRFSQLKGARLMDWARGHLPEDAVVAIPPYLLEPLTSFRYGARRSIVGTLKDGGEASFSMAFTTQWMQRIEALCDCKPFELSPEGSNALRGVMQMPEMVLAGYRQADATRFRMLATRFGATHAVIEAKGSRPLELPLEYEDDEYKVYRITPPGGSGEPASVGSTPTSQQVP